MSDPTHLSPRNLSRVRWKREIVSIGAGDIVRRAHVPAYARAGHRIRGVFDVRAAAGRRLARDLGGVRAYGSLADAFAERGVVFDVAVPPGELLRVVTCAPRGAALLVQKPFGRDLAEARAIVARARERDLTLAVNFQLRFAPAIRALESLVARGTLGEVREVEIRVVTHTPWDRWPFLAGVPRLEILYHSIHYLDLLRALFGEPDEVRASARPDPAYPLLSDTRNAIELWYRCGLRASIRTNHAHAFGRPARASDLVVEGTRGALRVRLGVNIDYLAPPPDELWVARGSRWTRRALAGSWFPDAFAGTMSNLQRFLAGEDRVLATRAEDALLTMRLVEACYRSSARGRAVCPR